MCYHKHFHFHFFLHLLHGYKIQVDLAQKNFLLQLFHDRHDSFDDKTLCALSITKEGKWNYKRDWYVKAAKYRGLTCGVGIGSSDTNNSSTSNLDRAKSTCTELGFTLGTEKHGECVLTGWQSAEYFELSIESGIVVHADGQLPKADEVIHPHSGIKEAEER